ncbi:IS1595 family transposase [Spiroplasma endosymbiont of Clivina fossor]
MLGQSSRIIANFINTSTLSAWFNRQKLMKSKQLAKTQKSFKKLSGIIEIDETFIKEIHKGNFKSKDDPRKLYIEPNAKNTKCCIQVAIDENLNIYAQVTNTKRLKRKWVEDNLTNKLIKENSLLKTDMHPLYDLVAIQTKCKLKQVKHNASKKASYYNLKNVSKVQSSIKEFLTHYHGIGFTNIQDYLNLWKWKYQHYGLNPYQQSSLLYFNL